MKSLKVSKTNNNKKESDKGNKTKFSFSSFYINCQ